MAQNHVLLETIHLAQTATSVTFDNLPTSGYTDLKIVLSARTNITTALGFIGVQLNNTNSSAYKSLYGYGTGVGGDTATICYGYISGEGAPTGTHGVAEIYIPNYLSTEAKTISIDSAGESDVSTGPQHALQAVFFSGVTSAVTSVKILATDSSIVNNKNFLANSTFSIYGVAAKNTTPVTAPFATGGNIVANDGTYWYHAFLSSGTFTPLKSLTCDYLVVAGGGSGGVGSGGGGGAGGGGAGGFRTSMGTQGGGVSAGSSLSLTTQKYPVLVGAGAGASSSTDTLNGLQGNDSVFASITSTGGGYGSGASNGGIHPGGSGGSGGGASEWNRTTGTSLGGSPVSPTQGYRGGNCAPTSPDRHGAGGGGAGGAGGDTVNGANGVGGTGLSISYITSAIPHISSTIGGGGGGSSEGNAASGGSGGGGAGLNPTPSPGIATSGTANTGGGGGGAGGNSGTKKTSGAGGSGIVVIRYAMV